MSTSSTVLRHDTGSDTARSRAWIEVSPEQILTNLRSLRAHLDREGQTGVGILPMVKANAYGLGADRVVETLLRAGDPGFRLAGWGVATVDEGLEIMKTLVRVLGEADAQGPNRVQVFSPLTPDEGRRGWRAGLHLSLSDLLLLQIPTSEGSGMPRAFDVEVDTGMGRAGLPDAEVSAWGEWMLDRMAEDPSLVWDAVFTHLHSADEADEAKARAAAEVQLRRFNRVREVLSAQRRERGLPPLRWHLGNSAGAVRFPDIVGPDMAFVRPGISLYGGGVSVSGYAPKAVFSVFARVTRVVEAAAGTTLGYGVTHVAQRPERWATLALGYGDGFPRRLSPGATVLLHGVRVPVIGRISMDMTVVEVSGLPAGALQVGDVACVVGTQDADPVVQGISLQEVAELAGTIDYEILTGWTPRLPRVWTRSSQAEVVSHQPSGREI
jgi:alanine racemase